MPLYPPAGTTLSDATPANVQPGVPDAGVATEASRDDHAHDASWSGVAPSASAPGDAAATGAAQGFNRRDHVHGRESYATIASNLKLDDLAAPDDNTDLNVLTTKHGLAPKLSNVSTEYLSGTGVYSVPAGGGAHATSHQNGGADEISIAGLDGTPVELTNHLSDATDAHDASAISVLDTAAVFTATEVESALKELYDAITGGGIPGTIVDAKGDSIWATAADTVARVAAGANGTVPTYASGATAGMTPTFPPGYEFDYVQITSPVSVTATVEATPNDVVVGSAVTYDGSTNILIEFYAPNCRPDAGAAQRLMFLYLYDGTTSLGYMALLRNDAADDQDVPVYVARRLTPSAASHTYKVGGIVDAGTGTVNSGAGGAGNAMPGFIRITKV